MAERVIVAVDGGPAGDMALEWVIDRAKTVELFLEITAVVPIDLDAPLGPDAEFRGDYEDALLAAKKKVTDVLPLLAVTTKIRRGLAHEELKTASRRADLLVIGSNKTSSMAGLAYGTLALKVAGKARCITIVVPVDWKRSTGKVVAGWAADETGDAALDFAAREAVQRHANLTIVHAWSAPLAAPMQESASAMVVDEVLTGERVLLDEAAGRISREHPGLDVIHALHPGSAAVAIIRAASEASLVVVGSRGRGAVAGFFLGSVSHDVLLNMPAPVAVVPRAEVAVDVYPELVETDSPYS